MAYDIGAAEGSSDEDVELCADYSSSPKNKKEEIKSHTNNQ